VQHKQLYRERTRQPAKKNGGFGHTGFFPEGFVTGFRKERNFTDL
jgi:hypothetical protein